tara:strand:- start:12088 stop:12363 length:276 start_codon:yes stop_codon:yes gene_type:complete
MYILIAGNLTEGHDFIGPFHSFDAAVKWEEEEEGMSPKYHRLIKHPISIVEVHHPDTIKTEEIPWEERGGHGVPVDRGGEGPLSIQMTGEE